MRNSLKPQRNTRAEVLESFALRWSVLSAWHEDLRSRGLAFDAEVARMLEACRVEIASGCVSCCEVGCDLARVEAAMVARTAVVAPDCVDEWLSMLSEATTAPEVLKSRRPLRSVSVPSPDCGYLPCVVPV